MGSHGSESMSRSGLDGPLPAGYDDCVYSASERTSGEHSADWPSGTTGSGTGNEKEPASEVDSFDAFLAEKVLGKNGSSYEVQITPRRTDLEARFH